MDKLLVSQRCLQAAQPSSPAILKELRAKPSERARGGVAVSTSRCSSVFVQNNPGVKCAVLTPALVFTCTDSITTESQCVVIPCSISQVMNRWTSGSVLMFSAWKKLLGFSHWLCQVPQTVMILVLIQLVLEGTAACVCSQKYTPPLLYRSSGPKYKGHVALCGQDTAARSGQQVISNIP